MSKKSPKLAILLPAGLLTVVLLLLLSLHFTTLRFRSPIDPIGAVLYRARSSVATSNVERAHFHISEANRLVDEINAANRSNSKSSHIKLYQTMLWHNEQATKYMLAAEAKGSNLEQLGLIDRLCDSLKEQYALIAGVNPNTIDRKRTLSYRVKNGENLQTVFNQVDQQLQTAMSW